MKLNSTRHNSHKPSSLHRRTHPSPEATLPKHGYWINHTWVRPGRYRTLVNPATTRPLALVGEATAAETLHAIDAARDAFDRGPWRDSTAQQRGRILFAMADVVRRHKAELARLETLNMGKPLVESGYDMDDTATCFEYYGGLATKVTGDVNPVPDDALNFTLREPVGVCGLIIPWNYPLMMLAWKVAPALAAGCTMVLKPAEQTPLTALAFAGWLKKEVPDLPPGVLNIITGDGEICGATLVRSPKVDKIAFTGGTETGQAILRMIGETGMKKISLELGGKSPNVFFADADLKASIDGALFGVMINQGEVCSAGSRILVERKWHDRFLEHLVRQASQIPVGDPMDPAFKMGPLVTEEHRDRVWGFVERAREEGIPVVAGGKMTKHLPGWYYPPTVLADVPPDAEIFQQEVFGPVVTVTPFEDEAEAVALANQTPYGLAGAIWTRDIFRAFRMVKKMRAGIIWVNTMQPCFVEAPWGGYKASGIGRELGRHGIEAFLEAKQVHVNLNEKPIGWYD